MLRIAVSIGSAALFATIVGVAKAQDYPNRAITIVVPVAAGSLVDTLARMYANTLHERLAQPVVVENRPGASQMIGAERVARSAGDGYTLLFITPTFVTTAAVRTNLPFDPLNDLTGVSLVGATAHVVAVHPSLPAKTLGAMLALARNRPGQVLYGSSGIGSVVHLAVEMLAAGAKIELTHIPYKSGVPAVTNAISGEVQLAVNSLSLLMPHVKAKRLRALAVTTAKRSSFVPDIPTVSEAGVPGYDVQQWYGMLAPSKTPREIVTRLNGEMHRFLKTDAVISRLAVEGAEPASMSPESFNSLLQNELSKWKKIVRERDINVATH